MKLWLKIFLSILLLSLITLFLSIYFMMNNTHLQNVQREQDRSLNELSAIEVSILKSVDVNVSSNETIQTVISRLNDFYSKREISLILFQQDNYIFNGLYNVPKSEYTHLLDVNENNNVAIIITIDNKYYILASELLSNNKKLVLIYARDISYIYTSQSQNFQLSLILFIAVTLVLGIFSYLYSKWITKPFHELQKSAVSISLGDYSIRIPESKDEFNDLADAFNNMAMAIENRTLELEKTAKEKQTFIDDLAHEMNTPLTSIQGYSEFLQNVNTTEEQRLNAANCIRVEAKRMKEIYNKLMTLTLTREKELDLTLINSKDFFMDIYRTFFNQMKEKNISFQINNELESIFMDKTLIHILISNIIKNSIQALPNGGSILVHVFEYNSKPVIEISDNGHGIPSDQIEMITKPFYRVDKSRSRKTGGAGLGLSICKNISLQHGLEFIIESKEEIGTKVILKF